MIRRAFFHHMAMGLAVLLCASPVLAGEIVMPPPGDRDKCPVCGMFVKPYPEWTAAIVYRDGHTHYFDGAKDLFRFLEGPSKYVPNHRPEDVTATFVTEYYSLTPIQIQSALFVIGSDVLGPMGRELIPLATPADAAEFIKDHGGRAVRFEQVTPEILKSLDPG